MKPVTYGVLLTVAGAFALLTFAFLRWRQRQGDEHWPTVRELRKDIRAGAETGSQARLQGPLDQSKRLSESLASYSEKTYGSLGNTAEEILSHESDDNKQHVLPALSYRIAQKVGERGWERLTGTERHLLAVQSLEAEVFNGGFDQYFFNSTGDDAEVALAGLKEMQATEAAVLLERAMAVFPGGKPPTSRTARWKVMDEIESLSKPVWNKCDNEFYHRKEDLGQLSLAYAKKNRAQIILP